MKYRHLALLLAVLLLPSLAFAKARFMPKQEMIESSDAIVIGTIQKVEELKPAVEGYYRQKATVTVSQTLMGTPVKSLELFGGEMFICAQCNLKPGTYLMFLKKRKNLWTGTNWDISLRPVKDGKIQWYGKNDKRWSRPRTYLSKEDVLADISTELKERELIQAKLATIDKQLATKQKPKRLKAIETLRRFYRDGKLSPQNVYREISPRLVRALDDSDAEVQANALCGLADIGAVCGSGSIGGEKTLESIRKLALSDSPRVCYYAILTLKKCGDIQFRKDDALLKHLLAQLRVFSRPDPGLTFRAVGLLGRDEAVTPLLRLLDENRNNVHTRTPLLPLTMIGSKKAARPLFERMGKPEYNDRSEAIADTLRALADPRLKEDLLEGAKSKDKDFRRRCIIALGVKGWGGAIKPLLAILEDSSETANIRRYAATSIAYIGTAESVAILQRGLLPKTDKRYLPTDGGYDAIALLGITKNSAAMPILLELLRSKRIETVISAANALPYLGDYRAARPLLAALKRPDAAQDRKFQVASVAHTNIQNAVHFAMMSLFPEAKDAQEHFFSGKGYDWSRVVAEQEYRMERTLTNPVK